ncbi:Receptor L domain protein [Aequorivita sublithincola DSM 14238]|uniref:Receptor L domain protein n=1 Tax=Aequorivita sublithincola (strain DSM 14238 / LMG 21431 / ACAM 643 / 9-3) TaxID=746697 RepID=I3YWQ7_AEQSU|nr:T9SS type A sorting domain-containing protein [Aequorivita sublithincola]AFL81425.1 Receptor L domain protein [Aequorivita sublithincola DSM 14238]
MNSKILFSGLLVFIFSASNLLFGQCSSISFSHQYEIDNFATSHPGCTELTGTLNINDSQPGNITNLNGLSQITKVKNLKIIDNIALTNLNGLNNLTAITDGNSSGNLFIVDNTNLQDLDALENLQEVLRDIRVVNNASLTSIQGLHNIVITTPEITIIIEENPLLVSLSGLSSIPPQAGFLKISNNELLTNLNGLNNLTELSQRLEINHNPNLINFEGLNNLTTIGGEGMLIYFNPSLESFNGLESLISVEDAYINGNTALLNIEALSNFTSSADSFGIVNSPLLSNLNGLENLDSVNYLSFGGLNNLNDISALSNVNMSTVNYLSIGACPQLSVCAYTNICQYLDDPSNEALISDNAPGCASRQEILQACGLIGIHENISSEKFTIHPNPTNGAFTISGINEGTVQISDSRGRILKTFTLGKDETSLNVLSEGVYFVNVTNNKGSSTKQLMKI